MAAYSESPPTIFFDESNEDVFPREKNLPYNVNPGHGGATAILLHTHRCQSTAQSQVCLVQSGFNSNTFNTKLISKSGLGIPAAKDNEQSLASISGDLQTDHDGNLIMKIRDGKHNVTLFSNQAAFTSGGSFPQRESSSDGILEITLPELEFVSVTEVVEETIFFLIGCSTSRSDENTPVACCYHVEIGKSKDGWKLDSFPAGKCGSNEMKNSWKLAISHEGVVRIEGPPDSHFVFFCNRSYAKDTPDGSRSGKVFFTQTYNGEHSTTLLPKIRTHYGRAMFLLCSRSNPQTNLVTSALYFVAPMVNKVGVYYIAESNDDCSLVKPRRSHPFFPPWLVSKKIGKLVVRLKPDVTGPCRYAFISNAPEDLDDITQRCLQSDCIATGTNTPLHGHLSVDEGHLKVWTDRRVEIKVESHDNVLVVQESDLREQSGQFVFEKDVSSEIGTGMGIKVFRASVALKNIERKDVVVELTGSPCHVRKQLPGVHFACNFGGPAYIDKDGVVFNDGRSAIASICQTTDCYYYGCHIDPLRNYPQVVGNTEDGSLHSTFIGSRPSQVDALQFKIPVPVGRCVITLYMMSSGFNDVKTLMNGEDVSTQIQEQLQNQVDSIPGCTAMKASIPVTASCGSLDISLKCDGGVQLSAILIQDEDCYHKLLSKNRRKISAELKQEIGDDLAPLDRHIAGSDIKNLAWSGDILKMKQESALEQDSLQWRSQYGGDGMEKDKDQ